LTVPEDASHGRSPLLIVLSGPSGVGKDAVLSHMRRQGRPYHYTVTATTRSRRPAEVDGVDYIFVTGEEFAGMIERGELMEWAEVYGHRYGVPRAQVVQPLSEGKDVIIKADVQGAATIRRLAPDAIFIFLTAPSMDELAHRLSLRMTESPEALKLRLHTAEAEMAESPNFDYVVTNHRDRLDETARDIEEIVARERTKERLRELNLQAMPPTRRERGPGRWR
jgi:guanylate kinase